MEILRQHNGFATAFEENKLTLGLVFPLETYEGHFAKMDVAEQMELAKKAENLGFAALFIRDTPLFDPNFSDAGAMYDPWIFLSYVAAHTNKIALGTSSIVSTLRHPLHMAKAAASLDLISSNRFLFGLATGDRKIEFPAFKVNEEERSSLFRESVDVMKKVWQPTIEPIETERVHLMEGNVFPKPALSHVPLFGTGYSGQTLEWLAENMDGWFFYPQNVADQRLLIQKWRAATDRFKPFTQTILIDLSENPNEAPKPIKSGFRTGYKFLIDYFYAMQDAGVNHIKVGFKASKRSASEVIQELGEYVVPHFKARR